MTIKMRKTRHKGEETVEEMMKRLKEENNYYFKMKVKNTSVWLKTAWLDDWAIEEVISSEIDVRGSRNASDPELIMYKVEYWGERKHEDGRKEDVLENIQLSWKETLEILDKIRRNLNIR
tara:strand:- start:39 stop:398 length:360 start_codon:yes stop_codon:yes gene_type:complete